VSKGERPITLRAMLAADCSTLPSELRHLIHVMALHANNVSGRGLTGQETLARYLGCSSRTVRRLQARLDTLWESGESPVGLLREKRWLTSDAYQIVVREGAALALERSPVTGNERSPMTELTGHPWPHDRSPVTNQPDTGDQKGGVNRTPVAYKLRSGSTEPTTEPTTEGSKLPRGAAAAGASARQGEQLQRPAAQGSRIERARAAARASRT
jgi:hypothetical protein